MAVKHRIGKVPLTSAAFYDQSLAAFAAGQSPGCLLAVVGVERVIRDLPGKALKRMQGKGLNVLGLLANLINLTLSKPLAI